MSELSRLGRSLGQIIQAVDQLLKKGVSLIAIKESIRLEGKQDLQTKVTIALFGLFAEIERDFISERTKEGLAAARTPGRSPGRPRAPSVRRSSMEKKVNRDVVGQEGLQGIDRQDPGCHPEYAILIHPIASPQHKK